MNASATHKTEKTGKMQKHLKKKHTALLFSLMRDNKYTNSTAYGGVQAGRCSKQPLFYHHMVSLIGVLSQRGAPKETVKQRKNAASKTGAITFDCFNIALSSY